MFKVQSPADATAKIIRFGLFEVDLENNELRRKGLRLKLQDQPLKVLRVLLDRPGVLVTRDELRSRLWEPGEFVEFDHSLNTAMMRLREVLGDPADNPRFIQTVPRKGYKFIAPVHDVQVEEAKPELVGDLRAEFHSSDVMVEPAPGGASIQPDLPKGLHPSGAAVQVPLSRVIVAGVCIVLVAAIALFVYQQSAASFGSDPRQITSIAVLPMENLSGDSNQEYFADGMTDELIASLARISSLRVVSRTTAMDYKGTHESLEKIAHDLHVEAVVEGTVLRSGDRVRITAELVQVSTDRHLWADTYESPLGDVLALQNQVASAIVSQIRIKLTPQDKVTLAAARPINSDAFEDYLKGRYYWGKRSEDALGTAIRYFQSATQKDPNYALAYAGLADCYGILGAAIVGTVPTAEVAPNAEAAAKKAVELDSLSAETQTALATVEFNDDWNWKSADEGFRRAIQLNPSYATAHQRYSLYLMARGRTEDSLAEMKQARSLEPLSLSMNFSLGWRLYMARRYDDAIAQLLNTIEMDPNYLLAHIVLGQSYEQKGRYADAVAELQKADLLAPNNPPVLAALGHVFAISEKRAEALKLVEELKVQSSRRYVSPFYLASVYAGLGDVNQALGLLEKSYDDRSNNTIFIDQMPQFDKLRTEPRFQELRRRVGLTAPAA
ncbi:MAG: adenylate/guanylate cyclase domain-containing protein [Acidobacteriaceae bacterium]